MNTIILEYNILRYAYARFSKELLLRRLATANCLLRRLTLVEKRE